jgi:hypothetical protein
LRGIGPSGLESIGVRFLTLLVVPCFAGMI